MEKSLLEAYIKTILNEALTPNQVSKVEDKYKSIYSGMLKGNKKKLMKYVDPKFKRPNPDAMAMGRAINLVKKDTETEEVNETLKLGVKYELPTGETGFIMTGGSDDPRDWMFKKQPYLSVKDKLKPASKQPGKYDGAFDMGHGKGHHIDEESINEANPTWTTSPSQTGARGTIPGAKPAKLKEKEFYEVGDIVEFPYGYSTHAGIVRSVDKRGNEDDPYNWDYTVQMRGREYKPGSRNYHDDEWNGYVSYPAGHKVYGEITPESYPKVNERLSAMVREVYTKQQQQFMCAMTKPGVKRPKGLSKAEAEEMCKDTAISKKKLKEERTSTVSKSRAKSELKQILQGHRDDGMGKSTLKAVLAIDKDGKETKINKLEDFSKFEKGTKFALKETTMNNDRLTELIKTALKGPVKEDVDEGRMKDPSRSIKMGKYPQVSSDVPIPMNVKYLTTNGEKLTVKVQAKNRKEAVEAAKSKDPNFKAEIKTDFVYDKDGNKLVNEDWAATEMEKKKDYGATLNPASISKVDRSYLDVSKKDDAISYVLAQLKDFISMVEDPNHKRIFNTMIKKLEDAKKESVKEGGGIDDDKFNSYWGDGEKRDEEEKDELKKATKKDQEDISSKVKDIENLELAEDKDWIQKAIKRPGALHRELGVPKDKDIPKSLINKTLARLKKKDKDDEEEGTQLGAADERELRQLNLAKTLSKFNENKLAETILKKLRG